ncbi:MAG: hypothetical protein FJ405_19310, partial [Verrucomicrobia bacterium]|nr:hypothetical protein [Verrucomicrobiota bacterium]
MPDGVGALKAFPGSSSPGEPNYLILPGIVINEVLARPHPAQDPFVEFLNLLTVAQDVSRWWLSDDVFQLKKFQLPAGSVMGPGNYLVVRGADFGGPDALVPFMLDPVDNPRLFLSEADASGELTGRRTFMPLQSSDPGHSIGPVQTTSGLDRVALISSTPGQANTGPLVGPVIISEIQYDPRHGSGEANGLEFIEIQNVSLGAVSLHDENIPTNVWRLRDAVGFEFPVLTKLAPGERILVLPFDPSNTNLLDHFRSNYSFPSEVRLFGPWQGSLANEGEPVELVKPDPGLLPPGRFRSRLPEIVIDRVRYDDAAPWPNVRPTSPGSLQRISATAYGNEAGSWLLLAPSPGRVSSPNSLPSISLTGVNDGMRVRLGTAVVLEAQASDSDGEVRRIDFLSNDGQLGSVAAPPYRWEWVPTSSGAHAISAQVVDDRLTPATSPTLNVVVLPLLTLQLQPTNGYVRIGSNTTLSVSAISPDPLRYQWRKERVDVPGATNAQLQILRAAGADIGSYDVVVSDSLASATSAVVRVEFLVDPAIVIQPMSQGVLAGGSVTFSVEVTNTANLPLSYRWRRGGTAISGGSFLLNSHRSFFTVTNLNPQLNNYSVMISNIARPGGVTSSN